MIKCFVLEINDLEELPALINFEFLKRMKNEEVSFNVSDSED